MKGFIGQLSGTRDDSVTSDVYGRGCLGDQDVMKIYYGHMAIDIRLSDGHV